ncbi:PREDICTED: calmin [Chaetura pelagica]|uniref:calmin n=1 Tax=Chaetura pelagica TaxID=8897 RepID=UPI00052399A1|nr:PREDICTED: calmin [Chaetura pelagica]
MRFGEAFSIHKNEDKIAVLANVICFLVQAMERENVQKRTFTRWINLHLGKCKPPLKVKDLFIDIQDGKILMALLEVLSGQKLMHEYKSSTHRIFRLNNIAKALKFLEDSNVKLVSIDAAEIADGNSSLVLGLIWNIILFFQIKELTGNLNRNSSSSSLSSGPSGPESDTSHPSTPSVERNMPVTVKDQRKAIRALLIWVQRKTRKYGVAVQDFTSSWRSGLAFLAIIKAIDSTLVDIKKALEKSAQENLEDAFSIAQNKLGVPRLLEPEDIMVESPDEQSIVTYVAQFLEHFPELEGEDFTDPEKELPIELTYVHIKDSPSEKEGKILILSESQENMYMVNHERSHPAPPKVHIHDTPERILSETTPEKCNGKFSQVLGDLQETSEEELQRPTSLKITGSVSFESNSSWEVLSDKLIPGEGGITDPLKQNNDSSPAIPTHQKNYTDSFEDYSEELTKETSTEYDNETKSLSANTSSLSPLSWTSGILTDESISKVEESKPHASSILPEGTSKQEDTHKYVLQLLNEEILKIPQNEHTKQSPVFETIENNHCSLNGSNLKSEEQSTTHEISDDSLSDISKNPEDVDSCDEVDSSAEVLRSSSKVSVIPHNLFYYPHYNVPISAVLDAYLDPYIEGYDTGNDKASSQTVTEILHEKNLPKQNYQEDASEPDLGNKPGVPPSEVNTENGKEETTDTNSHINSSDEEMPLLVEEELEIKRDSKKATNHQDSTISQHPEAILDHQEHLSTAVERPEQSSNVEEKGKNMIKAEDLQISEAGITTLSQDKPEEIADCQELTRTSESDSNTYLRKRSPNTTEEETYVENEKMTDMGENPLIIRKKKDLEASETPAPTHEIVIVEQPELFYFILFFWVLVYCLLLIPQFRSNKA